MQVRRYHDAARFRRAGAQLLSADPARNNLVMVILQVVLDDPQMYPVVHLWMAMDRGRPVGLAIQTEPRSVLLAEPLEPGAVEALADAILADGHALPGVVATVPWVGRFAERVTSATGRSARRVLDEGVWELTAVADVPLPGGSMRAAVPRDRDLLRTWLRAFEDEALPDEHPWDEARAEREIDLRLSGRAGGYWLWDDGEPVCLSGHRPLPGVGSRIGPVYTPPEHRRRGYATGLVAELSAARLASGDPACFLYTDMANPTSNAVYARVGFVKVGEAVDYVFEDVS